jgi:3-hydroxybutyryl-CoA dehydratase
MKKNFNDVNIGDKAVFSKTITEADIFAFSGISGDFNPIHVSEQYAQASAFKGRIAHGMLVAGLIDRTFLEIIGEGGIHVSQTVRFKAPVKLGDTINVESVVQSSNPERKRLYVKSTLTNQNGKIVLEGEGEIMFPM